MASERRRAKGSIAGPFVQRTDIKKPRKNGTGHTVAVKGGRRKTGSGQQFILGNKGRTDVLGKDLQTGGGKQKTLYFSTRIGNSSMGETQVPGQARKTR